LPEPGSPDKTISVGDIFVISVMTASKTGAGSPPHERSAMQRG